MQQTDDLRIQNIYEAEAPATVHERHPITDAAAQTARTSLRSSDSAGQGDINSIAIEKRSNREGYEYISDHRPTHVSGGRAHYES